jgi:hypothetical protein
VVVDGDHGVPDRAWLRFGQEQRGIEDGLDGVASGSPRLAVDPQNPWRTTSGPGGSIWPGGGVARAGPV